VNLVGSLLPALRLFFEVWSFLVVFVLLLTGFAAVALWLARRIPNYQPYTKWPKSN
jgi:hypothetical protein